MRTLVDLPDDDIRWLDRKAADEGKSRAAVLRELVSAYRCDHAKAGIERYFGIWRDRPNIGDAVEWQRRERAASTRPWDPDYEEVRAEYPDLFDEQDDREHEFYKTLSKKKRKGGDSGDAK